MREAAPAALVSILAAVFVAACGGGSEEAPPQARDAATVAGGHESVDEAHPIAGNFEPNGTRIADCKGDFKCLEQAFGNLAFYEGPRPTIRVFDRLMGTDDAVEGNCHRIVHSIGSAALARYDGN